MEEENRAEIEKPLCCMKFHLCDKDLEFTEERDHNISSFYQGFVESLTNKAPVVGYMYYHGFKSSNIYDKETGKGKVLSSNIDLQDQINYETYKYLQTGLRQLGINFHFVVLRDTFQALTLQLDSTDKQLYKGSPEILQYGESIQKISSESDIASIDCYALKNINGESFEEYIENNLQQIIKNAENVPHEDAVKLKAFLEKEYESGPGSNTQKKKNAMIRAKRYQATLDFMRKHEASYLVPTFKERFGENYIPLPFSTQESHVTLCKKVPLRNIQNFIGGCNSQHQLPLLQQMTDGTYKMYTIRSDMMNKILKEKNEEAIRTDIGGYSTFFYKGDEDFCKQFGGY